MAIKTPIDISFARGLDTKTDPKRVAIGNFLTLENSIFTKGGLLQKRNGNEELTSLPNTSFNYVTTFADSLTAIGTSLSSYSSGSDAWFTKGPIIPIQVSAQSVIKNNYSQTQSDNAISLNGLVCIAYSDTSSAPYKYAVLDQSTGDMVIPPTALPTASGTTLGSPKVFALGNYFIVVFTSGSTSTPALEYVAISTANPSVTVGPTTITSAYAASSSVAWDGVVVNNKLYLAWNTTTGGQAIQYTFLAPNLSLATPVTLSSYKATIVSLCTDGINIWISFYSSSTSTGYTLAINQSLVTVVTIAESISSGTVVNIASAVQNGICTLYSEIANNYGYDSSIPTHYINAVTINSSSVVGSSYVVVRSVGLASKAFIVNGVQYFVAAFQSPYQPTYFVINGSISTAASPVVVAKIAYENGGGYCATGLPSVYVGGATAYVTYLYKDLIESLNTLSNSQQTTTGGIYSQTGINLLSLNFNTANIDSAEIGNNLNISGGFLWMFDGALTVEQNFFLWPDSVEATWSSTGGSMGPQPDSSTNTNAYYYQVVYTWTDNQGNIFRSAPSIPVAVTTTGTGSTGTGSVTLHIPTLRLTYKTASPVQISVYRWSVANQLYYQVSQSSSVSNPILAPEFNSTTIDYVTIVDTWNDSSIVGNSLIYTTGGVLENINGPASNIMTLFDTRLWVLDAEEPNLWWYSQPVIEGVNAQMSDLLTYYVSPTAGAQGSTGPITAAAPMDDKLIHFKKNAIYYTNGIGPDATGSNSQYSQPIFITSSVGCTNQQSIVLIPQGLMFQSEFGIWLLGRDLNTNYIGSPVEQFNSSTVLSSVSVPGTTQVRFTLNTGQTLMYDYFFQQWGVFVGAPAISSTIYEGLHTFIDQYGRVFQESPGSYLDGANPVLMSFTTSWINVAGLQGYERAYFFYFVGDYISPHKLNVNIAYNYNPSAEQNYIISPSEFSATVPSPYGSPPTPFGSPAALEQEKIHFKKQLCQSFQISINEVFDPTYGTIAGAGLNLSGLNIIVGVKRGYRPIAAAKTA